MIDPQHYHHSLHIVDLVDDPICTATSRMHTLQLTTKSATDTMRRFDECRHHERNDGRGNSGRKSIKVALGRPSNA